MDKPTLKEVSAMANVSIALCSVVLNGKKSRIMASDATRKRILDAAKELGYVPDRNARGLRLDRSFLIGVLAAEINSSFVPEILSGIESFFFATPYSVLLATGHTHDERIQRLEVFLRNRVDGLICIGRVAMDEIWNRFRVPKVFIGMESSLPNSSSVFVDGVALGVSAARAFLLRGHRRFGYLCNSESNRQGFLTALQDAGIPQENIHLKQCRNFWEEGLNATRHLLSEHPEITALFADSDLLGAAALKIASEIGRRIPNDLAVIGVDDSPICRMITPELSSLHQPRSEQGTAAAQMLLDMCNGNEVKNKVFFGDLVIRRSLEEKA